MYRFKEYISETKLVVKPKVLDIKDFISKRGTYTINKDGSIDVKGSLDISDMKLEKIPWNIKSVSGDFSCANNQLKSLGKLERVGGSFVCDNNKIETLGNLKYVGGGLYCSSNNLKSLGKLERVGGSIWSYGNKLTSLGRLERVGGKLHGTKLLDE